MNERGGKGKGKVGGGGRGKYTEKGKEVEWHQVEKRGRY